MANIAVFGGTFNPFHIGHYEILKAVCELEFINKVFLMPDKIPPHKECDYIAEDKHRQEMCNLVCQDFEKAELCLIEFERDGKSYTYDTINALKLKYPDDKFFVVIGGDMLSTLDTWFNWQNLIKTTSFIAFKRKNVTDFDIAFKRLTNFGAEIFVIESDITAVSSTELRKYADKSLFPPKVYDYITEKRLYMHENKYTEYKELLEKRLTPKRYNHSLCVANEAVRLAEKYGCDTEKAYLAGLLHDVTKNASPNEHLHIFDEFGIILSDVEKNAEKLWHAISGAAFVEHKLNICDSEIITAIRYHTTARKNMSLLEKVLYLADFTSADRDYDDLDIMRQKVDVSIPVALEYALSYTINDLVSQKRPLHLDTVEAYNEITLKGAN